MAKQQSDNKKFESQLSFPVLGVDEQRSYSRQRPGTAPDCLNVRVFDPLTDRARGGSRPGIAKVYAVNYSPNPAVAGTPVTNFSVQEIIQMTTTGQPPPAVGHFQQFTYAQASGSGVSIGDGLNGTNLATVGVITGEAMSCSCWDDEGFSYVAMTRTAATATTRIYKINYLGVVQAGFPTATYNIASGSLRNVCGIAWIRVNSSLAYVFFAIKNASNVAQIYRINASNGASPDGGFAFTETNTSLQTLTFSSSAVNCLCSGGGLLGVESIGNGTNQGFRTFDPSIAAITTFSSTGVANIPASSFIPGLRAYTSWGGTGQNNATKVVSDGASFYVIASATTNILKKISVGGVLQDQNTTLTPLSIEIDSRAVSSKVRLVVLVGSAPYVRLLDTAAALNATALASGSPGSAAQWDEVGSDGNGTYMLFRNAAASNNFMTVNTSVSAVLVMGAFNLPNTTQSGAAVNKGTGSAPPPPGATPTVLVNLMVKNGEVFTFDPSQAGDKRGPKSMAGGASFSPLSPQVFGAQVGTKCFFADGTSYRYFDGPTGAMVAWTPSAGTLPKDSAGRPAKLICNWRARVVMAVERNIYMARQFDGLDWNYSPSTTTAAQPFQGNADAAGELGDLITCLIPYDDDTLVVGCDHSIWIYEGDPMDGGRLARISEGLGIAFGRPFCFDPQGVLYFMGSDCSVYKMVSGSKPEPISKNIRSRLRRINLDPRVTVIKMAWDQAADGLYLFITPIGVTNTSTASPAGTPQNPGDVNPSASFGTDSFGTGTDDNPMPVANGDQYGDTTHFFWERRTEAWQPMKFANRLHNPIAVYAYDGDLPEDRRIYLGCRDGYVRRVLESAGNDDGTPVYSWVLLGPIQDKDGYNLFHERFKAVMGDSSGDVRYDFYWGATAEQALTRALAGDSPINGTLKAGDNRVRPTDREGFAFYIKLSSTDYWILDDFLQSYHTTGNIRRWTT